MAYCEDCNQSFDLKEPTALDQIVCPYCGGFNVLIRVQTIMYRD